MATSVFARRLNDEISAAKEVSLADALSWSIALVIDPPQTARVPDQVFLTTLASANPQYTGWPVWLDSRGFTDRRNAPIIKDKAWEALVVSAQGWSAHLDFSRLDPRGDFFLRRVLQDDLTEKIKPNSALDPILVLIRVSEAIAVGLAFARALGWKEDTTRLGFAFRWTKLSGARTHFLGKSDTHVSEGYQAHDNEVVTFTELSLDTPASAIAPIVEQATQDLFAIFNGYKMPTEAVEEWTRRLVERRLG